MPFLAEIARRQMDRLKQAAFVGRAKPRYSGRSSMSKISLAFRCFFACFSAAKLTPETDRRIGYQAQGGPAPVVPTVRTSDGALQMLSICREMPDFWTFLWEDIAPYSDEQ